MKAYIYETHLHTSEASACASSGGADYVKIYRDAGYAGVIVTDHFFNGNTTVPQDLDWETRVNLYCKGYENAKTEADRINASDPDVQSGKREPFQVFFGIEHNFEGDDYLLYGIEKDWLLAHPEIMEKDHAGLYELMHSAGGIVVHAHPFRRCSYITEIALHPDTVDAVEIHNSGNDWDENNCAARYAEEYHKPATAGTDLHDVRGFAGQDEQLPSGAVAFETRLSSVQDYAQRVKNGKCKPVMYSLEKGFEDVPLSVPPREAIWPEMKDFGTPVKLYK